MSRFSGKCDFYDHLVMRNGKDTIMQCFDDFKKNTGGVIYQFINVKLTRFNIERECSLKDLHFIPLERIEHKKVVKDKRCKSGTKEVTIYTYKYGNKVYDSLKEINAIGYARRREIKFDTLLDLVPYFPYLISIGSWSGGKEYIVISNESFVDIEEKSSIEYGRDTRFCATYRKELQKYYIELVNTYYKE